MIPITVDEMLHKVRTDHGHAGQYHAIVMIVKQGLYDASHHYISNEYYEMGICERELEKLTQTFGARREILMILQELDLTDITYDDFAAENAKRVAEVEEALK